MKSILIVKLKWLEESLLSKTGKPRDAASYLWEQRKVTKCGIKKRKRGDDDLADVNEEVKKKPAKRQKKPTKADKDRKIAKAGEYLFHSHGMCLRWKLTGGQETSSTKLVPSSKSIWGSVGS